MLAYFLENTHSTSGLTRELALNNNLKREHGLLQRQVAEKLGIDEARISEILRGKIEGFTLDRLISYAEELYENVQVNIIAA